MKLLKLRSLMFKLSAATIGISTLLYSGIASATVPFTLTDLEGNLAYTGDEIWTVVSVILTLAGLLLVASGLVNLKQHYHGSGQEKFMTKGIAKLAFGAALFIVIPITHALVGGVSGDTQGTSANQFQVNNPYNQSLTGTPTTGD